MGEVLVVVAAGPGLGRSVALRFAREGADVALVARSAERLEPLADEVRALGVRALAVAADVADESSLRQALAVVRGTLGDPTVAVYNGSEYVEGNPTVVAYDDFVHCLLVGIAGALVTVQEVAPAMRAAGRGTVLLTGSEAALRPYAGAAAVGVAKAGLRSLALSAAEELAATGAQVTTVTIRGRLKAGTRFDPDVVADHYWAVHRRPREQWEAELVLTKETPPAG